jgi:hypothetical protein
MVLMSLSYVKFLKIIKAFLKLMIPNRFGSKNDNLNSSLLMIPSFLGPLLIPIVGILSDKYGKRGIFNFFKFKRIFQFIFKYI